jgi:hypothetical protein
MTMNSESSQEESEKDSADRALSGGNGSGGGHSGGKSRGSLAQEIKRSDSHSVLDGVVNNRVINLVRSG